MQRLPHLIQLVFQRPKLSDAKIGQQVGRTSQTVRRYINICEQRKLTWTQLKDLGPRALDRALNQRRGARQKRGFDAHAVNSALSMPGVRLRDVWRSYAQQDPETAMGYAHFARLYRAVYPWQSPVRLPPTTSTRQHRQRVEIALPRGAASQGAVLTKSQN
jgi:hypothetical protein